MYSIADSAESDMSDGVGEGGTPIIADVTAEEVEDVGDSEMFEERDDETRDGVVPMLRVEEREEERE